MKDENNLIGKYRRASLLEGGNSTKARNRGKSRVPLGNKKHAHWEKKKAHSLARGRVQMRKLRGCSWKGK